MGNAEVLASFLRHKFPDRRYGARKLILVEQGFHPEVDLALIESFQNLLDGNDAVSFVFDRFNQRAFHEHKPRYDSSFGRWLGFPNNMREAPGVTQSLAVILQSCYVIGTANPRDDDRSQNKLLYPTRAPEFHRLDGRARSLLR